MNITVNGEECDYVNETINYETVCLLAGCNPKHNLSVTYRAKLEEDLSREGTLWRGDEKEVKVVQGMIFNCYNTSYA